jgi:hypothetical protein
MVRRVHPVRRRLRRLVRAALPPTRPAPPRTPRSVTDETAAMYVPACEGRQWRVRDISAADPAGIPLEGSVTVRALAAGPAP